MNGHQIECSQRRALWWLFVHLRFSAFVDSSDLFQVLDTILPFRTAVNRPLLGRETVRRGG